MPGLELLIGKPINQFAEDGLPTIKDVLRFYAQFWGVRVSESNKEKLVAEALINFYQRRNIPVLNEKTIKNRISNKILSLKKILKFSSKTKTVANIEKEIEFRQQLDEIFDVSCGIQNEEFEYAYEPMEMDNADDGNLEKIFYLGIARSIYLFNISSWFTSFDVTKN